MELLMKIPKTLCCALFFLFFPLLESMSPKMHFFDEDSQLIYQVNAEAGKMLKKRYHLEPMGTGCSAPDGLIIELNLAVRCYADLDIEKGRALMVKAARTYLEVINASKKLQPLLATHPFGPKNIDLTIYVAYPGKHGVEIGKLTAISVIKGNIAYKIRETQYTNKRIHTEAFEEAEKIVQSAH